MSRRFFRLRAAAIFGRSAKGARVLGTTIALLLLVAASTVFSRSGVAVWQPVSIAGGSLQEIGFSSGTPSLQLAGHLLTAAAAPLVRVPITGSRTQGDELARAIPIPEIPGVDLPPVPGLEQQPQPQSEILVPAGQRLAAFSGLSTWVDLYDTELTPTQQAQQALEGGVEAIYVQTARFNSPADIHDPSRLGELIEAAHERGMRVMAWYIPNFVDVDLDFRRSQAAISFVTPRGERPDAFGLDIETEHVRDTTERTRRLLVLSHSLRDWVGPAYPMAAIVLPPLQLDLRQSWWPNFPYAELRPSYDVFIPMSYSSFRGQDADTTYSWNLNNVLEMRRRSGDPGLNVHLAGGIADRLPALDAFVAAARDGKVMGAGLYDLDTTRPDAWATLRALRTDGG